MTKKMIYRSSAILAILIATLLMVSSFSKKETEEKKMNILFIAIDDFKPLLGCYGVNDIKTPNLDLLAKSSTIFTSAYCQQAVCGPTRASLLTGLRPDKTQVWDLQTLIRDKNPDIVTLPQYLKSNGYQTMGMGKIFDPRSVDKQLDEVSWSVPYKKRFKLAAGYENLAFETYQDTAIIAKAQSGVKLNGGDEAYEMDAKNAIKVSTECLDIPDDAYTDGAMANYAVKELSKLKNSTQPFFMAVGFKKPHLPFVAPKKYWDLYDRNKIKLAEWQKKSIDGPDVAYHNSGELRSFVDIKPVNEQSKKSDVLELSEDKQRELIHGYYACVSYIDEQIGKLIDALKQNGLDKNTMIVLWGDHGWHLGDHSLWCKHSNFEQATRVPLIINIPGMTKGNSYNQPVEFVDLFPTICELNGIQVPGYIDGKSLIPVLKNTKVNLKDFAISQYPRGAGKGAREIMGYSLRNKRYRYTEWVGDFFNTSKPFDPKMVKAVELYDMEKDPNETRNLANSNEYKSKVEELGTLLHQYYAQQLQTAGKIKD